MKFVILASLLAATYAADCTNALTDTLPKGYAWKEKTAWSCAQTATAGTETKSANFAAADATTKTDKFDYSAKIKCASGYMDDGTGKRLLDCTTPATTALKGCKEKPAAKKILGCDDKTIAALANNYAGFKTGAGTNGQKVEKACIQKGGKNQAGKTTWTCVGGTDPTKGSWTKSGSCVDAAWESKTIIQVCPLPKCGVAKSTYTQKCNTGTATDCTGTAGTVACPAAKVTTDCKAPTCDATKTVAKSPNSVGVCTGADTKVALGKEFVGATMTTTCTEVWKGTDDTQGAWKTKANGSSGGGGGGSSASTLSVFAAFAVILAYL